MAHQPKAKMTMDEFGEALAATLKTWWPSVDTARLELPHEDADPIVKVYLHSGQIIRLEMTDVTGIEVK